MLKKVLVSAMLLSLCTAPVFFDVLQKDMEAAYAYYEQAEKFSKNSQYSSAIGELKKGLQLNPYDSSIRIALINNYLLRATYYNNKSHEYLKAMNDIRSTLFYLKYYGTPLNDPTAQKAIEDAQSNLDYLYRQTQIAMNLKNRYQIAKNLKRDGDFSASAYEFIQASDEPSVAEDAYIQTGDLLTIMGNQQIASDYYKKALKKNPNNASTHLKLAKAYDSLGEINLANTEYNYTLSKVGNNRALLLELESIWVKKIGNKPNDAESHTNLGAVYQKLGDDAKALMEYEKSKTLNPKNAITRFNIATLYQGKKDYNNAISAYDEVLQLEPGNKDARFYKAQCYSELKQFEKAVEEYKKVLALDPQNTQAKNLMLQAMSHVSSPEEMLDNLAQATTSGPVDANTIYNYAYELHKANKLDQAIVNYQKAISMDPKIADAYINMAQAYRQINDFESASRTISNGLAKLPDNEELKKYSQEIKSDIKELSLASGSELFKQGNYNEAIAKYLSIEQKTADVYTNIGACYQALNDDKKAIDYYKLALAKEPNNGDIAFYLGQSYSNLEDWTNARSYLAKARTLKPENNNIKELYNYVVDQQDQIALDRALDMYSKGDYTNALAVLNNVLSQNKSNAFAYYYRGLIFDAQKKYELALNEYVKTVGASHDGIPEAYYSMALDYDYLGKKKEAYLNYQKYLSLASADNEYTKYAKSRMNEIVKNGN